MKLNFRPLLFSLIASVSVCSCTNENDIYNSGQELNITATIDPSTRANISSDGSGSFTAGDEITVNASNNHGNISAIYTHKNGMWQAKTYEERLLWKHLGNEKADFHAYYNPGYNQTVESINNRYVFRANSASGNQAHDVLLAYTPDIDWGAEVSLRFYHAMSKLTIIATSPNLNLVGSVVSVSDIYTDAATEEDNVRKLIGFGDKKTVTLEPATASTAISTGLFVPQDAAIITITTAEGNVFEYKGDNDGGIRFKEGQHLVLSLKLIKGAIELSESTITEWNKYEQDGGDLDEEISISSTVLGTSIDKDFNAGDIITVGNGGNSYLYTVSEDDSKNKILTSENPLIWRNTVLTNGRYEMTAYHEPSADPIGNNQKDMLSAYAYTESKYSPFALRFNHRTARVIFNVTVSNEIAMNSGSSVIINDLLVNGCWSDVESGLPKWIADPSVSLKKDVILEVKNTSDNSFSATGLVIAQTFKKASLSVMDGNISRDFYFEKEIATEAGKTTVINLTVQKGIVNISSITVNDWEYNELEGGVIDNEKVIIESDGDNSDNDIMILECGDKSATYTYSGNQWNTNAPVMWGELAAVNGKYNFTAKLIPAYQPAGNRQKDLLSAYVAGVEKYETMKIAFSHATASVNVELKLTEGVDWDHSQSYVRINNVYTVGNWDNTDKNSAPKWTADINNEKSTVTLGNTTYERPVSGSDYDSPLVVSNGLIIAQQISSITVFAKSGSNERSFTYSPASPIMLEAGKNTKLTLTLRRGEVVIGNDKITITDWIESGNVDLGDIENN